MRYEPQIAVSIVAYGHSCKDLSPVLESSLSCAFVKEVFVVDNGRDAALRRSLRNYPITYLDPGSNLGYGAAHNLAIKESIVDNDYHAVLNPDIYFPGETLTRLSRFLDQNSDVGMVMPKILYNSGAVQHLCKKLPTPYDLFLRRFAPDFLRRLLHQTMEGYELKHLDYDLPLEPPNLSGCFMFFRSSDLQKTGGFDERFFMYFEDIDLVRRTRRFARAVYYPHVHAYHGYEKGSYRNYRLLAYHLASAVRYFHKWGWFIDKERAHLNRQIEWFPESALDLTYDLWPIPAKEYMRR
jgi:GT2 family glycosyltransferase